MNERVLRRQCRRTLQSLDIQPPLRVPVLCERLGLRRGRPIRLVAYPLPVPGPFGLWIASPTADYLLYQRHTSAAHQNHIILHEIGHVLAGHRSDEGEEAAWSVLTPDALRTAIRHALRRTCYDSDREREAELVATIILEWACVLDQIAPPMADDPAVRRLQVALGDHQGWQ
ncbi:MAG TPA: hypothetical protein VHX38_22840 [Pseudonocardiaceae bacterium]|jgi:hypothetical protein|nr:hypothetical protein [Pseudonocardiaceae bacterium]